MCRSGFIGPRNGAIEKLAVVDAGGAGGRRLAGTLGREYGIGAERLPIQFVRLEVAKHSLLGWNRRGEVEPSVILRAAEITFT